MNPQDLMERLKSRPSVNTTSRYVTTNTRPLNMTSIVRSSSNKQVTLKSLSDSGLPIKLDKLPGNIQLLTSNSCGQTSLIPVFVSGDEIFHVQSQTPSQNNIYVLSNSAISNSESSPGNQVFINNSLTSLPLQMDSVKQSIQHHPNLLGFQSTAPDHSVVSGLPTTLKTSSKVATTQSLASPVYKSKLEKAVAQNLLMQNMAKDSSNAPKSIPLPAGHSGQSVALTVSVASSTQNSAVFTSLKSSPLKQALTSASTLKPDTKGVNSDNELKYSPTKLPAKVSKVAEYYKNLISGKIPPVRASVSWKQGFENTQPSTQPISQFTVATDETYSTEGQSVSGVNILNNTSMPPSYDSDIISTTNSSMINQVLEKSEIVKEKTYTNLGLGYSTLETLWKLREDGLFCDAVLIIGSEEIKLHRLVLMGASPAMCKEMSLRSETELKLVLPKDFITEHVMTFLYYIYHGVLKLSIYNVQQIYRLSNIFGIGQLSKYCYDFCKLSKMGHLIIDSPYQENAKQIRKTGLMDDDDFMDTVSPTKHGENIQVTSSPGVDNITTTTTYTSSVTMTTTSSSSEVENFDGLNSDINWPKSEQSNIPIRKRGRSRKITAGSSVQHAADNVKSKEPASGSHSNFLEDIASGGLDLSGKFSSNISKCKTGSGRSDLKQFEGQLGQTVLIQSVVENNKRHVSVEVESSNLEDKENNGNNETIFESFPDPLLNGRLDENELMRIRHNDAEENDHGAKSPPINVVEHSGNQGEVTPEKNRNDTNSVSNVMPTRTRRKRVVRKIQRNQTNAKSNPEIRRILSNPSKSMQGFLKLTSGVETKRTPSIDHSTADNDTNVNSTSQISVSDSTKQSEKSDVVTMKTLEVSDIQHNNEVSDVTILTPKKARLRKSTLDQQDERDTHVYMRPPPKKRTKEIREMMRNEEDGIFKQKDHEDNSKLTDAKKTGIKKAGKDIERLNKKSIAKRKHRMKNDAVMAKVYEIEKLAVDIEGEKVYRCSYCAVEFKFAKRAITHLVGTHNVYLDDTSYLISVEMKREKSSEELECELCGYKPKESGSYYIHYHKYFRHQIPLPKGWQAYKCDLCHKEFFTKFQLREHKLIHFEDNPFVCDICGSGFRSRTCLNSHVFHKHNSVRKHKCSECPKTFKTMTQMKVHKRIHSGEKPFKCPSGQCSYRSTTRGNMKLHLISKHKLNPVSVKKLMEKLEASDGFVESVDTENVENQHLMYPENAEDLPVVMSNETANDTVPFDILVESSTLENDVNTKQLPNVTDQIGTLKPDGNLPVYNVAVTDNNTVVLNRDYTSISHSNLQGHDLDMVMHENGQILETQNMPRNVQILVQDAHRYMQQQDLPSSSQFVPEFQQHQTGAESQDIRSRFTEQIIMGQSYETPNRFIESVQSHAGSDIIDPHSKEARMIIKEAFSGNLDRSLLKSAIQAQRLDIRHLTDNSSLQDSDLTHNEAEKLVKDLHDQQLANSVSQDDDVVRTLRSQIQQLREYGRNDALFRDDQSVQEILLQNISSQQSIDPTNFTGYHQAPVSPPAYSSSGHGIISLSTSNSGTQTNVLVTDSTDEGQSQVGQGQLSSVMQGQGYSNVTSQASSNQYSTDGNIYQGYYQEQQQYDIENY
ncbi:hypothetical protein ACF0H5_016211 [Mactra antiquata]